MGAYINPKGTTKEEWLYSNAEILHNMGALKAHDYKSEKLPVCWVDNGPFTATAIGFSPEETEVFLREDGRPKVWFLAKKEDLLKVSEELKYYLPK